MLKQKIKLPFELESYRQKIEATLKPYIKIIAGTINLAAIFPPPMFLATGPIRNAAKPPIIKKLDLGGRKSSSSTGKPLTIVIPNKNHWY